MRISILVNRKSWIIPYARKLAGLLLRNHKVIIVFDHNRVTRGDMLVILSYEKLVPKNILRKNEHNLVVHESALPKGKGWSPLTWQILEGKNDIPITLFEATERADSGDIYFRDRMMFVGHELIDELRNKQGEKTISLILKFMRNYGRLKPRRQKGPQSFYRRRKPGDSELDINKPLINQFNLLRVVDNVRYPGFFKYRGRKYILRIYKDKAGETNEKS
ncbi:MAG: methionyl-tRNA formyltransferase [Candidatus Vogelbacteria bacterium]|nr:methionyl-tRNA formyltransferase [Candidatus Vogelbacteria bacterium]